MSIRGHVQIRQPKYGNETLSSLVDNQALEFMLRSGVTIYESESGYQWEIDIDDAFNDFVLTLDKNPEIFDDFVDCTLAGNGYGNDLLNLLKEGMRAAKKNGYSTICIDWW